MRVRHLGSEREERSQRSHSQASQKIMWFQQRPGLDVPELQGGCKNRL